MTGRSISLLLSANHCSQPCPSTKQPLPPAECLSLRLFLPLSLRLLAYRSHFSLINAFRIKTGRDKNRWPEKKGADSGIRAESTKTWDGKASRLFMHQSARESKNPLFPFPDMQPHIFSLSFSLSPSLSDHHLFSFFSQPALAPSVAVSSLPLVIACVPSPIPQRQLLMLSCDA